MENKIVPELRFQEFVGEWKKEPLKEYINQISGFAFKGDDIVEDNTGIRLLRGINITEGYIRHNNKIDRFFIGDTNTLEKYFLLENDLVLAMDGSKVGKNVALVGQEDVGSLLIQRVARIRANDNSDIDFIFQNIFSEKFRKYVDTVNTSSGIPHISSKQINHFKVGFPSLPEQKKIATFLKTFDKRIEILEKRKSDLEQYKNGVMQKLFSQTTRFKNENGNNFPAWEEKKLGDLGETFNGLTGKTKVDFGEGKPYIQYMQIFSSSLIDTSQFGLVKIEDGENQSKAQLGDVFFTTSSETPNEIGTSSVLTVQVDEVYLNSFCFGYRPNSLDELVPEFSQFFFRSENVRRKVIKLAQGSTRFNMSKLELMKLKFDFPKKDEQIKIANFLISIDKSIEKVGAQIEDSILFKQGLLQKMFV